MNDFGNRWCLGGTLESLQPPRSIDHRASSAGSVHGVFPAARSVAVPRADPKRARLLRAAARQLGTGDMRRELLAAPGRRDRARSAVDCVRLPHAVAHYIEWTGDRAALHAAVRFRDGPAPRSGEGGSFFRPMIAAETSTLFEHCARALDRALALGEHGLPIADTGDWRNRENRDRVRGSDPHASFARRLCTTLVTFAPLADAHGERVRAAAWRQHMAILATALGLEAGDGR